MPMPVGMALIAIFALERLILRYQPRTVIAGLVVMAAGTDGDAGRQADGLEAQTAARAFPRRNSKNFFVPFTASAKTANAVAAAVELLQRIKAPWLLPKP